MVKLLNRCGLAIFVIGLAVVFAGSAHADSVRLSPESGFDVHDYIMNRGDDGYHGGIDIGYAQLASGVGAAKTRCILKTENYGTGIGSSAIRVTMYDYTGEVVVRYGNQTGLSSAWAQAVRLSPDKTSVLYSYTDYSGNGDWYEIEVNPNTLMPVGSATQPYSQPMRGNWEVEYDPESGEPFFAGRLQQWSGTHSIWIWDDVNSEWQEVVDVTGYSCGFAFDSEGNLWTGTYTSSGPMNVQYIRMYDASQIADAVDYDEVLEPVDAAAEIELPHDDIAGWWAGANDVEVGPDDTIYVTCNSGWTSAYNSEVGFVIRIENNGSSTDEDDIELLATSIATNDSDWQKALAYDGESYLDDPSAYVYTNPTVAGVTANRLFVDQDTMAQGYDDDTVTVLTVDGDYDSDGVPNATDNAPETTNDSQLDTDRDMYANKVDADLNNDNSVDSSDETIFDLAYDKSLGDPGYNEHADFDGDDDVDDDDEDIFDDLYSDSAPYY